MTRPPLARSAAIAAAAIAGCGLAVSAIAQSAGVSLRANLSERIDIEEGDAISNTGFVLNASSATRRASLDAGAGFNLIAQTADGDYDLVNPNLSLGYRLTGKRTTLRTGARLQVQPVEYTDVDDNLNLVDRDGLRQTTSGEIGLSYQAREGTQFTADLSATDTRFDDASPALVPSQLITLSFGATQDLSRRVRAGVTLSFSDFDADGGDNTASESYRATANLRFEATPNTTLSFTAGGARTETERDDGNARVSETDDTLLFGASLDYTASSTTSLSASVNQNISPNSQGALSLNTVGRLGLTYGFNADNTFNFDVSASRRENLNESGSETEAVQFGATYNRQLDRLTALQLGYTARQATDEDLQHRFRFSINRSFVLKP